MILKKTRKIPFSGKLRKTFLGLSNIPPMNRSVRGRGEDEGELRELETIKHYFRYLNITFSNLNY